MERAVGQLWWTVRFPRPDSGRASKRARSIRSARRNVPTGEKHSPNVHIQRANIYEHRANVSIQLADVHIRQAVVCRQTPHFQRQTRPESRLLCIATIQCMTPCDIKRAANLPLVNKQHPAKSPSSPLSYHPCLFGLLPYSRLRLDRIIRIGKIHGLAPPEILQSYES